MAEKQSMDSNLPPANNNIKYTGDLHRAGAIISETISLLNEYSLSFDWNQVKGSVFKQNVLKKKSPQTANNTLRAFKKRFFSNVDLPAVQITSLVTSKDIPITAKNQILFAYLCETDLLVKEILLSLVREKQLSSKQELLKEEVYEFIQKAKKSHSEIAHWSESSTKRWCRGFLSVLRDHGFMEKSPSRNLKKPAIRIESFVFFLFYLLDKGIPIREALHGKIWDIFFLDQADIYSLLNEAQKRGWIRYLRAGEIIELTRSYSSLEDWGNGLG